MSTERRSHTPSADRAVEDAWRAASREQPPARLDASILAAARAEAQQPQRAVRRSWWTHWQPLAAAASVAALAFLVVQLVPRDGDVTPPPALERQEAVPAEVDASPAARSAESAVRDQASAAPVELQAEARQAPESLGVPPPAPAAPPSTIPLAAEATANDAAAMSAEARQSAGVAAREATRASPASAPPPAPPTPEEWAQRVAALYQAGSPAAAAAELRAFRETYPGADGYLPADLRPWAATLQE